MDINLKAILLRFPEHSEKITEQIEKNEDFKSLCADYELCIDLLKALEMQAESKRADIVEYLEIKIELEHEVLKYLH